MAAYFYSPTKQKILLLLVAGAVLGLSHSPRVHSRIWKGLPKAWRAIDKAVLWRILKEFKYKRLVDFKEEKDGAITVVLTERGEKHALRYDPENVAVKKPIRWDKKWRIVIFDIPEKKRLARDAFRGELKKLGFFELQKSTWVFPYASKDVIDFWVEFFEIRNYVRYIETSYVSLDADLRLHFKV